MPLLVNKCSFQPHTLASIFKAQVSKHETKKHKIEEPKAGPSNPKKRKTTRAARA
jgi:hypothetical protein